MNHRLTQILDFLRVAEQLKSTLRSGYTAQGRPESTAEHTWRLCLMAMLFEDAYPDIDHHRLLKLCVIHDLGEALHGDIPAIHQDPAVDKAIEERRYFLQLLAPLPADKQRDLLALWDEYHAAETLEARLAKAFDKLETVLQHTQGRNPPDFDYAFNLGYARQYTDFDPLTQALRAQIDAVTMQKAGLRE
ncbi:MAG TPA: phosphohydrolase [Chloroflexi bacterium]|nr:phosphohydrolase [Chloroflexota bacterium]HHW88581.1 HD domain-containing protein [Chloroflexota bacterium]